MDRQRVPLEDGYALSKAFWLIEVYRQYPFMHHQYPDGPTSIPDDELAVYIMHAKAREQIEDRAAEERLRRVMNASKLV